MPDSGVDPGAPELGTGAGSAEPRSALLPRAERGWWKLLLGLVAFLFVPAIPQVRALLPVEQTLGLLVPALAACAVVGWWSGGRSVAAAFWVALATWMTVQPPAAAGSFENLCRGWSLLLAGAFGLVCLLGPRRPLFSRALGALSVTLPPDPSQTVAFNANSPEPSTLLLAAAALGMVLLSRRRGSPVWG